MKRVISAELLDTDSGTHAEIAASLADLRMINTWFGGVAVTEALVQQVAARLELKKLSLLEVAAGSGFLPNQVRDRLKPRGVQVEVTVLDQAASHLNGNTRAIVGDALQLPFSNDAFDVVSCNLFAHHLSPEQLPPFVDEALRVCRSAVIVNDLIRDPLHLALVYAGFPLYRSRITRNDAPASVRQAYTLSEIRDLLRRTKAARFHLTRHYLFRMGVIAWKR